MGFVDKIEDTLNVSVTENGAEGFLTTKNKLVDLNFKVSSLRNWTNEQIVQEFVEAYSENPKLAIRWLFYLGDIREGLGERRSFKAIFKHLALNYPDIAKALICYVPEYTRWDNLFVLMDTPIYGDLLKFIHYQLSQDIISCDLGQKNTSLLAKWMPSINASSKNTRDLAKRFIKGLNTVDPHLNLNAETYRKMLSKLRKYLDVVEVKTCNNRWSEIDYSTVPSKANIKYKNAFMKHDSKRRQEFLDKLTACDSSVKINASVLYPHEIVANYMNTKDSWRLDYIESKDQTLEELWKNLKNVLGTDNDARILTIQDGSDSMYSGAISPGSNAAPIDVSIGLAIYTAEKLTGEFHNTIITFGANPKFVKLNDNMSLMDKINIVRKNTDCSNTDIEKVFNTILKTATKNNLKQEDLPDTLLIVSDMEFDRGCELNNPFECIKSKWDRAGYKIPRLVFWNVCSRTNTIPVIENEYGFALVSGFSTNILKMVLSNECNPAKCLEEVLMTKRYDAIDNSVKEFFE